jgi:hypothetical protein
MAEPVSLPEIKWDKKMDLPDPEPMFFIRSLKQERNDPHSYIAVWWLPNQAGYTHDLLAAGLYTKEEADRLSGPDHATWINGTWAGDNMAVPQLIATGIVNHIVDRHELEMTLAFKGEKA